MKKLILTLIVTSMFYEVTYCQTDFETILNNAKESLLLDVDNITDIDSLTTVYTSTITDNGNWSDIDYNDRTSSFSAKNHLNRLWDMTRSYVISDSDLYGNSNLYNHIINAITYWNNKRPYTVSWWNRQIYAPRVMAEVLTLMRFGQLTVPTDLESSVIEFLIQGDPAKQRGANRTDIALHFLLRGALTQDADLVQTSMDWIESTIVFTTGEGLQPDYSFMQHGKQPYIGGYGREYLHGTSKGGYYTKGTSYFYDDSLIEMLSKFALDSYYNTFRGQYIDWSVMGRGVTRVRALGRAGDAIIAVRMRELDQANASRYSQIINSLENNIPYQTESKNINFWRSDYALHSRKNYLFTVKTSDKSNVKTESQGRENLQGRFLSDGATTIMLDGDEYFKIFPVWEWNKIPGTTSPAHDSIVPRRTYIYGGRSNFSGGVSDGKYGLHTHYLENEYSLEAKKGWFFFDDEIVCLGAGITSTSEYEITTTVNQANLDGDVVVSNNNTTSTIDKGSRNYNSSLDWVLHDKVGYYFPNKGELTLSNQEQVGNWRTINTLQPDEIIRKDVFKLYFNHGKKPVSDSYSYVVVPKLSSPEELKNYSASFESKINIVQNTEEIQAVMHNELDILQIIFYNNRGGTLEYNGIKVSADKRCGMMLTNVNSAEEVNVYISDISRKNSVINTTYELPNISGKRLLTFNLPTTAREWSKTKHEVVDNTTEEEIPLPTNIQTNILNPVEDAFVRGGSHKNNNYGSASSLIVKNSGSVNYRRESFLKFDLSKIKDSIVVAKLKLTYQSSGGGSFNVLAHLVEDDSWSESNITWNNKPSESTFLDSQPVATDFVEWDVTNQAYIENINDKTFSVKLSSLSTSPNAGINFYSKELDSLGVKPVLEIITTPYKPINTQTNTLTPVDDAFVRGGNYKNNNYGSVNSLVVKNSGSVNYRRESFLKFDLSKISDSIVEAKVRLSYTRSGGGSFNIQANFVEDDTWSETSITWKNKPNQSILLDNQHLTTNNVVWDVTGQAFTESENDGLLSLKMSSLSTSPNAGVNFDSKETDSMELKPVLELVTMPFNASKITTLSSSTALQNKAKSSELKVHPNSFNNYLYIKNSINIVNVYIYDYLGNIVKQFRFNNKIIELNLSDLASGAYIVRTVDVSGNSKTKKIIKQH